MVDGMWAVETCSPVADESAVRWRVYEVEDFSRLIRYIVVGVAMRSEVINWVLYEMCVRSLGFGVND